MLDKATADAPERNVEARRKVDARLADEQLLRENALQQKQDLL